MEFMVVFILITIAYLLYKTLIVVCQIYDRMGDDR